MGTRTTSTAPISPPLLSPSPGTPAAGRLPVDSAWAGSSPCWGLMPASGTASHADAARARCSLNIDDTLAVAFGGQPDGNCRRPSKELLGSWCAEGDAGVGVSTPQPQAKAAGRRRPLEQRLLAPTELHLAEGAPLLTLLPPLQALPLPGPSTEPADPPEGATALLAATPSGSSRASSKKAPRLQPPPTPQSGQTEGGGRRRGRSSAGQGRRKQQQQQPPPPTFQLLTQDLPPQASGAEAAEQQATSAAEANGRGKRSRRARQQAGREAKKPVCHAALAAEEAAPCVQLPAGGAGGKAQAAGAGAALGWTPQAAETPRATQGELPRQAVLPSPAPAASAAAARAAPSAAKQTVAGGNGHGAGGLQLALSAPGSSDAAEGEEGGECSRRSRRRGAKAEQSKGGGSQEDQGEEEEEEEEEAETEGRDSKRPRFSVWQTDFLERRFLEDTRLEPERKQRLAREIGVRPRQVAVWFQNRRVRWRAKKKEEDLQGMRGAMATLQRECSSLQLQYNGLKADYEALLCENHALMGKVAALCKLAQQVTANPPAATAAAPAPGADGPSQSRREAPGGSRPHAGPPAAPCHSEEGNASATAPLPQDAPREWAPGQPSFLQQMLADWEGEATSQEQAACESAADAGVAVARAAEGAAAGQGRGSGDSSINGGKQEPALGAGGSSQEQLSEAPDHGGAWAHPSAAGTAALAVAPLSLSGSGTGLHDSTHCFSLDNFDMVQEGRGAAAAAAAIPTQGTSGALPQLHASASATPAAPGGVEGPLSACSKATGTGTVGKLPASPTSPSEGASRNRHSFPLDLERRAEEERGAAGPLEGDCLQPPLPAACHAGAAHISSERREGGAPPSPAFPPARQQQEPSSASHDSLLALVDFSLKGRHGADGSREEHGAWPLVWAELEEAQGQGPLHADWAAGEVGSMQQRRLLEIDLGKVPVQAEEELGRQVDACPFADSVPLAVHGPEQQEAAEEQQQEGALPWRSASSPFPPHLSPDFDLHGQPPSPGASKEQLLGPWGAQEAPAAGEEPQLHGSAGREEEQKGPEEEEPLLLQASAWAAGGELGRGASPAGRCLVLPVEAVGLLLLPNSDLNC